MRWKWCPNFSVISVVSFSLLLLSSKLSLIHSSFADSMMTMMAASTALSAAGGALGSAKAAQFQQLAGSGINAGLSRVYYGKCSSTNKPACWMAAAYGINAASLAAGAMQSGRSADYYSGSGACAGGSCNFGNFDPSAFNPYNMNEWDDLIKNFSPENPMQNEVLQNLKDVYKSLNNGIEIRPDGKAVLADGSAFSLKDVGNMEKSGASPEELQEFREFQESIQGRISSDKENWQDLATEALQEELRVQQAAGTATQGGSDRASAGGLGGGAGGSAPSSQSFMEDEFNPTELRFPWDKGDLSARDLASESFSIYHGDDRVGVAADDIFQMITRRYRRIDFHKGHFNE